MSASVIPFPSKSRKAIAVSIDWTAVEEARRTLYCTVPKVAVCILRLIKDAKPSSNVLATGNYFVRVGLPLSDALVTVPRDNIATTRQALELLDRLDRYGGQLAWGGLECHLAPAVRSPELCMVHPISRDMQRALVLALASQVDHRVESSQWVVVGKELDNLNLLAFLIENEGSHYLGLFDRKSGIRMINQLKAGYSIKLQTTSTQLVP